VAADPITNDAFRVSRCPGCDLTYTNPRPISADRYYPRKYRAYGPVVTGILGWLYLMRVSRWARRKPAAGSVLEIGCGPGLMLAAFRRRGWRVLGIERDKAAAQSALQRGLEVVTTPIEALPAGARFDLIIMFHVLEHMDQPVALLRECADRLAPGGLLIVNVPNFSSWQSRFAGPKWLHLDVPRHVIHFTPSTLAATLQRAGLVINETRFASLEHDPYGWVESALSRLSKRPNLLTRALMRLDPWTPAVLLSFALGALLLLPAVLLAALSWLFRRGALMEAVAVRSGSDVKG
jgi:SAM-dependent methyltransferase